MMINCLCWGVSLVLIILFVFMCLFHIKGPVDFTIEISRLLGIIIYALTISLIVFLISQCHTNKEFAEEKQNIEYVLDHNREVKIMTEFAKRQSYVDSIVTQAINGEIPKEKAIKAQKEFEEWQAKTLISDMKTYQDI